MDTIESKIEATHRLQREGRWNEASVFRDRKRKEFRDKGQKRCEASEEAWRAMIAEYPPLPLPVKKPTELVANAKSLTVDEDLSEIPDSGNVDFVSDILWVYNNMANHAVAPRNTPNCGAWTLLKCARKNSNWFFSKMLPKALAQKLKDDAEKKSDDDSAGIAKLRRMIADAAR